MIRDQFSRLGAQMRAFADYGLLSAAMLSLLSAQAYAKDASLGFDFKITLSEKAAAKLKSAHETICEQVSRAVRVDTTVRQGCLATRLVS